MALDELLSTYAPWGYFQARNLFVCCAALLCATFQGSMLVYIAGVAKWHCAGQDDTHLEAELCTLYNEGKCTPEFDMPAATASAEFGLLCSHAADGIKYGQSMHFVGMCLGCLFAGWSSDRFGRLTGMLVGGVLMLFGSVWSAVSQSFWSFVLSRLVIGMGGMWEGVVAMVLVSETVASEYRSYMTSVLSTFMTAGVALSAIVAYVFRENWRTLIFATSSLGAMSIVAIWMFVQESPQWLLSHGRIDALQSQLKLWTQHNAKQMPPEDLQSVVLTYQKEGRQQLSPESDGAVLSSYLSSRFRWMTLRVLVSWVVVCLVTYGMVLNVDVFGSNKYLSGFLISAASCPCNYFGIIILERMGRKPCLFGAFVLTTLFSALCWASSLGIDVNSVEVESTEWGVSAKQWLLLFTMGARVSGTLAFSILYTYTPELIPTAIRNRGLGVCTFVSRFGGLSASFVIAWGHSNPPLPYLVFTLCAILASIAVYPLPETKNTPLPQSLQDVQNLLVGS